MDFEGDAGNERIVGRRELLGQLGVVGGIAIAGSAALAGTAAARAVTQGDKADPGREFVEARTKYGRLRGVRADGVVAFKGIPYAGPVSGERRFKPPPKLKPWEGVRDALEYGPQSIQPPDPNMGLVNPPKFSGD